MPNTFPLHIEKEAEQVYVSYILSIEKLINKGLNKIFKVKSFDQDDETDPALIATIILGLAVLFDRLQKKALKLPNKSKRQFRQIHNQTAKWQLDKQAAQIEKINPTISVIEIDDKQLVNLAMESYRAKNIELVKNLRGDYVESVDNLVSTHIREGGTLENLRKKMERFTGKNVRKAKFWARDQLGTAYSQLAGLRQSGAGIPGYIWITMLDVKVRDSHKAQHGLYFTWAKGAYIPSRGQFMHPGEDYSCRCEPKPAAGAENELTPEQISKDLKRIEREIVIIERAKRRKERLKRKAA